MKNRLNDRLNDRLKEKIRDFYNEKMGDYFPDPTSTSDYDTGFECGCMCILQLYFENFKSCFKPREIRALENMYKDIGGDEDSRIKTFGIGNFLAFVVAQNK